MPGSITPAGQALVSAGLFTATQLQQLGAVAPHLANAPAGQVGMGGLFYGDLGLTYIAKIHESITLQPSLTFYNVTNSQNFDQGQQYSKRNPSGGRRSVPRVPPIARPTASAPPT